MGRGQGVRGENATGRTLIVPGIPQAKFTWGYTAEEPFEWGTSAEIGRAPGLAPLGSTGANRALDTIEADIEQGGSPELAGFLRRAGFSTVLVRNDADWRSVALRRPSGSTSSLRASGLATRSASVGSCHLRRRIGSGAGLRSTPSTSTRCRTPSHAAGLDDAGGRLGRGQR